jgi:hypothetical protein
MVSLSVAPLLHRSVVHSPIRVIRVSVVESTDAKAHVANRPAAETLF